MSEEVIVPVIMDFLPQINEDGIPLVCDEEEYVDCCPRYVCDVRPSGSGGDVKFLQTGFATRPTPGSQTSWDATVALVFHSMAFQNEFWPGGSFRYIGIVWEKTGVTLTSYEHTRYSIPNNSDFENPTAQAAPSAFTKKFSGASAIGGFGSPKVYVSQSSFGFGGASQFRLGITDANANGFLATDEQKAFLASEGIELTGTAVVAEGVAGGNDGGATWSGHPFRELGPDNAQDRYAWQVQQVIPNNGTWIYWWPPGEKRLNVDAFTGANNYGALELPFAAASGIGGVSWDGLSNNNLAVVTDTAFGNRHYYSQTTGVDLFANWATMPAVLIGGTPFPGTYACMYGGGGVPSGICRCVPPTEATRWCGHFGGTSHYPRAQAQPGGFPSSLTLSVSGAVATVPAEWPGTAHTFTTNPSTGVTTEYEAYTEDSPEPLLQYKTFIENVNISCKPVLTAPWSGYYIGYDSGYCGAIAAIFAPVGFEFKHTDGQLLLMPVSGTGARTHYEHYLAGTGPYAGEGLGDPEQWYRKWWFVAGWAANLGTSASMNHFAVYFGRSFPLRTGVPKSNPVITGTVKLPYKKGTEIDGVASRFKVCEDDTPQKGLLMYDNDSNIEFWVDCLKDVQGLMVPVTLNFDAYSGSPLNQFTINVAKGQLTLFEEWTYTPSPPAVNTPGTTKWRQPASFRKKWECAVDWRNATASIG